MRSRVKSLASSARKLPVVGLGCVWCFCLLRVFRSVPNLEHAVKGGSTSSDFKDWRLVAMEAFPPPPHLEKAERAVVIINWCWCL